MKKRFLPCFFLTCFCVTLPVLTSVAMAYDFPETLEAGCMCGANYPGNFRFLEVFSEYSCVEPASAYYKCERCGYERLFEFEIDHTWTETNRQPAACTASGFIEYTCSGCYETKLETIPQLAEDHAWEESSRVPATCTSAGSVAYTCSRCSQTKSETIPQLAEDHTWEVVRRNPATCTAAGSVSYSCSVCHESKTDSLPALGHAWTETDRNPATCTDPGYINRVCTRCGSAVSENLPALGLDHIWEETSRTEAVCAPGSIGYTCSNCGDTRSEEIPVPPGATHTYEAVEVIPAVYDGNGKLLTASQVVYGCSNCTASYTVPVGVSPPTGPVINEGDGGDGMQDATAALGKTFLSGIWALFGIYVPGFSFTFGQMWLGVLLASISILVVRMIFGFGGGPRGDSPRTSSTSNPKISKERRRDEF